MSRLARPALCAGLILAAALVLLSAQLSTAAGTWPPHSRDCFAKPGACGYPDPANGSVGPPVRCAKLQHIGSIEISQAGFVLRDKEVSGSVIVAAPNVTIEDVCVFTNGHAQLGSAAITVTGSASHTLIRRSTISGDNAGSESVEIAAANYSGQPATLEQDDLRDCGECVHNGPWTIRDSYMISNGMRGTSDHYEDVYCDDTRVVLDHDTAFNPQNQVAEVFCDTHDGSGGSCSNHVTINNSLLAGGGFVLYACGNASSPGSSTLSVTDNVFARCRTGRVTYNAKTGGYACNTLSYQAGAGADTHGYWPRGGYYGVAEYTYCSPALGSVWSGNIWDDNHRPVRC